MRQLGAIRMQYLIMSRSLTQAQSAAALLERRGIGASVIKAPQNLTGSGCGYAVSVYRRFPEAVNILKNAKLLNGKLFRRTENGEFAEVAESDIP